jgi:integrase
MATIPLTDNGLKKAIADINTAIALDPSTKIKKRIADGGGLTLMRQKSGSWIWIYQYRYLGRASMLSLGSYPAVTLAMARLSHKEAKEQLRQGVNPSTARFEAKAQSKFNDANSFEEVARQWFNVWQKGKNVENARKQMMRIEKDLFPVFGKLPIASLTRPQQILPPLKAIGEERGAIDIGRRMFGVCRNVFEYAYLNGLIDRNPLAGIAVGKVLQGQKEKHHPRVNESEIPALLHAIDNYDGTLARLGLQLMALVFVRHSELIGARWQDVDFERALWIIPASVEDENGRKTYGMKMGTEHRVPLSHQALAIFKQLHEISGGRMHVFPSTKGEGKTMSIATMNKALIKMGYQGRQDVHGFRGLASTSINERDRTLKDIVEIQLSHLHGNETERAYNAAEHMDVRTQMMQDWADYLDMQRSKGQTISMKRA